jgi:hypothetical protein
MSEGFVQVLETMTIPEGEVARARLEGEGIPVLVKGEGEGPYRVGPVYLWVPADLEVQARLILDAAHAPITDQELDALAEQAGDDTVTGEPGGDGS